MTRSIGRSWVSAACLYKMKNVAPSNVRFSYAEKEFGYTIMERFSLFSIRRSTFVVVFLTFPFLLPSAVADAPESKLISAYDFYKQERWNLAASEFESFLEQYPDHEKKDQVRYYLAESYLMLREYEKAADYFDKILSQGKENPFYRKALFRTGEAAYRAGQYETAKPLLVKFVEEYSEDHFNTHTLVYLGEIAKSQNHPEEAEHYFRLALERFPKESFVPQSRYGLAWSLMQQGEFEEGKQLCRQLTARSNHEYIDEAQLMLAKMQSREGNCVDALASLKMFELNWPESPLLPEVLRLKAQCHGDQGEYEQALATLDRLPRQQEEDKLLRVRCLYGVGRKEEANLLLDSLARSPSQHTQDQVRLLKASLKANQRQWSEAATLLEELLGTEYYPTSRRMVFRRENGAAGNGSSDGSGGTPTTLDDVEFLKACSLLTVCYVNLGDGARSKAVYDSMLSRSDHTKIQHQRILDQTVRKITQIGSETEEIPSPENPPVGEAPSTGDGSISLPTIPGGETGEGGDSSSTTDPFAEGGTPPDRLPLETEKKALQQARRLILANKPEEADETLLELLYDNPPAEIGAKAALLRGNILLEELQNIEEAQNMSDLILEYYPRRQEEVAGARFLSGRCHDILGEHSTAISDFQFILRYSPSFEKMDAVHYYCGWNQYALGQVSQARENFDRIYRRFPESEYWTHATWFLAQWQFERGNYRQADALVREIIQHPPDAAILDRVLYLKGQLASAEEEWLVAKESFQKIVRHCPESDFVPQAKQAIREASRQIDSGASIIR